jgi:hypothetical protein
MTDLEDRLNQTVDETRSKVAAMELRPMETVATHHRTQRLAAGVGAFALVVGVIGIVAVLTTGNPRDTPRDFGAPPATDVSPQDDAPVTTIPPEEQIAPEGGNGTNEFQPQLGLVLPGWVPVLAVDVESGVTVFYNTADRVAAGDDGSRVAIEVWSDVEGSPQGSGFEHAFEFLTQQGDALGEVALSEGAAIANLSADNTASAFTFSDPQTGGEGFAFIWQATPGVTVEVIIYGTSFEEATRVVQSIEELSDYDWNVILDEVGEGGNFGQTSPTTTIITPQP